MILLLGCAPLLQDEVAVPWEVATRTLEGALGYGRVLLVDGERIVVGSDDAVCDGSDCYAARDPLAVCVDTTLQWIEPDGLYGPTGRVRDFQSTAHAADFGRAVSGPSPTVAASPPRTATSPSRIPAR